MGEIDGKAKWKNTKKDLKSKMGEKGRRKEEQNWPKMGQTAYQKAGGRKSRDRLGGREGRHEVTAKWNEIDMKMRGCLGESQQAVTPEVREVLG